MRKIKVTTFVSLDGVMQAPGGPDEDRSGGFEHGGWLVNYFDEVLGQEMGEFMGRPFDLLLGRKTYEIFASHWPDAPEEEGSGPLNAATKYVVSNTLDRLDWGPSVLIKGDVVEQIRQIKQEEGPELQVHGSSNLLQTLIANNLVDEFHLLTFPVVIGTGKRLFGDGAIPAGLRLVDSKVSSTGVIVATYEPTGPIPYGNLAAD